jgi:hypothetical protein
MRRLVLSNSSGFAMPNPWDVPPHTSTPNKDLTELHAAMGRCLTTWELVENDIAEIFAVFTGSNAPGSQPAIRAYGTIISFMSRAQMVEAAADAYFHLNPDQALSDEFWDIMKAAKGWAGRRNDVAHAIVVPMPSDPSPEGFALYPGLYNSKKWSMSGEEPAFTYSSVEIDGFGRQFDVLWKRTAALLLKLEKHSADTPQTEPPPQPA